MARYKCEFYSKVTNKKEIALLEKREEFINLIYDHNMDCDKEIKIFERRPTWELAYHKKDGIMILHDFESDRKKAKELQKHSAQMHNGIDKAISFFDKDICPSRKEGQSHMDLIFDHFFGGEDISKPRLGVVKDLKAF